MASRFNISVYPSGGSTNFRLRGDFDAGSANQLLQVLAERFAEAPQMMKGGAMWQTFISPRDRRRDCKGNYICVITCHTSCLSAALTSREWFFLFFLDL
jgi:hypothetical protein